MSAATGTHRLNGHCLCGAVKFTAEPKAMHMDICHCEMCRRWSGGIFMAVDCSGSPIELEDDEALGIYRSSDWGERCFCTKCGTSLFWRLQDGSAAMVSAQAFDDPKAFELTAQIFVDEQPANYAIANETPRLTGAEVMAQFAGE